MKTADLPLRPQRHLSLRSWVLLLAGGQILFWLYTFRFIFVNSNPMGDGLEIMAIFPFGYIFLGLVIPTLLLGAIGRLLQVGFLLGLAGVVCNLVLFIEIAGELTGHGKRALQF